MEAVPANKQPHQPLTSPQKAAEAFLKAWPILRVENVLWEVFALASKGGLGETTALSPEVLPAEEVASLFDQLIMLVNSLEASQATGGAHLLHPQEEEPHV
jgi:hypothetical protein